MRALPFAVLLAACGGDHAAPADAPAGAVDAASASGRVLVAALPVTPNRALDLLFVIDDSSGMDLYQAQLAQAMPVLVQVLSAVPGGAPDLHAGVVTTDLGVSSTNDPTPGQDQNGSNCVGTGKRGDLQASLTSLDATALAAAVQRGSSGCGFEQSLAAMRRGLDGHNTGFVRATAALGVVFLTNEDDCSARSTMLFDPSATALGPMTGFRCTQFGVTCTTGGATPDAMAIAGAKSGCTAVGTEYVAGPTQFFAGLGVLKANPRDITVAGWFGPPAPVVVDAVPASQFPPIPASSALEGGCKEVVGSDLYVEYPAVRMHDFFALFPEQAYEASICPHDFTPPLGHIAQMLARRAGSPCIDPDVPSGTRCTAEDVVGTTHTPVGFRIETDATACPLGANGKLVVERAGAADPAATTELRCDL